MRASEIKKGFRHLQFVWQFMKTITLNCDICKKPFKRNKGEYARSQRLGRKSFCSLACSCVNSNRVEPRGIGNLIRDGRQLDEYSPFRFFVKKARARSKKKSMTLDITNEFVKTLWEEQNGKCSLTGWDMILPKTSEGWGDDLNEHQSIRRASLDRIDSSKGYVEGNVRFVCYMANICKNSYSDSKVLEFCEAVTIKNPAPKCGV